MAYLISRPTQRELRERLAESRQGDSRIRGRTRTTEEAHDLEHRLEKEGEGFLQGDERPFLVDGDAPESKQARIDTARKIPQFAHDPEKYEGIV